MVDYMKADGDGNVVPATIRGSSAGLIQQAGPATKEQLPDHAGYCLAIATRNRDVNPPVHALAALIGSHGRALWDLSWAAEHSRQWLVVATGVAAVGGGRVRRSRSAKTCQLVRKVHNLIVRGLSCCHVAYLLFLCGSDRAGIDSDHKDFKTRHIAGAKALGDHPSSSSAVAWPRG